MTSLDTPTLLFPLYKVLEKKFFHFTAPGLGPELGLLSVFIEVHISFLCPCEFPAEFPPIIQKHAGRQPHYEKLVAPVS